jgi:hypothetical protein
MTSGSLDNLRTSKTLEVSLLANEVLFQLNHTTHPTSLLLAEVDYVAFELLNKSYID